LLGSVIPLSMAVMLDGIRPTRAAEGSSSN
jgi:hypothetical protein